MMGRRTFLGTVGLRVLAAPFAAEGQQAKAPRVGLLGLGSAESSPLFEALRQGLRERGWVEGQNIAFDDRTHVDHHSRLPGDEHGPGRQQGDADDSDRHGSG